MTRQMILVVGRHPEIMDREKVLLSAAGYVPVGALTDG